MNSLFFFALPNVGYFCIQEISGHGGLRPFTRFGFTSVGKINRYALDYN
jgi:hypothetical protein